MSLIFNGFLARDSPWRIGSTVHDGAFVENREAHALMQRIAPRGGEATSFRGEFAGLVFKFYPHIQII